MVKAALKGTWGLLKKLGKPLAFGAAGTAVVGTGYGLYDMQKNGSQGFVGKVLTAVTETAGSAAAISNWDVKLTGLYSMVASLGELLMKLTDGKMGSGLIDWANESRGMAEDGTTPLPGSTDSSASTYVAGLINDFEPSLDGTKNLLNSASHGAITGITGTGAWVAGQAVDILNVGNFFSDKDFSDQFTNATGQAVNSVYDATIGLPDLTGHWAHATNKVASFVAPAGLLTKGVKMLSGVFGKANTPSLVAQTAPVTGNSTPLTANAQSFALANNPSITTAKAVGPVVSNTAGGYSVDLAM